MILGDFNLNCLEINENSNVDTFIDNAISSGYIPKISLPTRFSIQYGTYSLIDNILLKSTYDSDCYSHVLTSKLSDHFSCFIGLKLDLDLQTAPKRIEVTSFNEENMQKFVATLSEKISCNDLDVNIDANVSENYDIIEACLLETYKESFPMKNVKFNKYKHKKSPWITTGILISTKFRDKLCKELRGCKIGTYNYDEAQKKFREYKRILKRSIRLAKRNYYSNIFDQCKNDMKKTWQHINTILNRGKSKSKVPENFVIDGNNITNPKEIANAFNDFFVNIGSNLASEMPDLSSRIKFDDFLSSINCSSNFEFEEITSEDVSKAIDSLKNKTSYGYDKLTSNMIKAAKDVLVQPLTIIINQCLKSGIFPDKLKIAKVIPVYKKGDNSSINNYRPISLLPVISKLFERIIHTQLMEYFQSNNLLFSHQYGFRQGHSTEFAIIEFIDRTLKTMSNNKIPLSIFIDLSKAFDTLDHNILLSKLSHYGITGSANNLFSSYLANRAQYVNFNGQTSDFATITTGVPQGSILGPLLFLIYINDISKASPYLQTLSYADDTTFSINIDSSIDPNNISEIINTELTKIDDWLTVNKLSLNIDKTKYMIFSKPGKTILNVTPCIRQIPIEQVTEFNFLGVLIDNKLTWKPHISKISSKISKGTGILSRLKNLLPKIILLNIYNTLVLPFLNYAILIWGFGNTKRLLLLQKRSIRSISNSSFRSHTVNLFKELGLLQIDDVFLQALLKFYYKYANNKLPKYFETYKYNPVNHNKGTRFSHIITNSSVQRKYCDQCVRYGLMKIINHGMPKPSNHRNDIYDMTTTVTDKITKLLSARPTTTFSAILPKVHTHEFTAFSKYVKLRLLES